VADPITIEKLGKTYPGGNQDYALWPHLTARDNVAFALRRRRVSRAECRTRALEMLSGVGLGALADRYPNELSGGEQQRVALARALIGPARRSSRSPEMVGLRMDPAGCHLFPVEP
jgi:ABC-type nitrate/sulfonate/bicarbonate transport system ATPase subunit